MYEHQSTLQGAVDFVGDMIKRRIELYGNLKHNIPSWDAETDAQVTKYVAGMDDWIIGIIEWCFATERYFGTENDMVRKTLKVNLLPKKSTAVLFPERV